MPNPNRVNPIGIQCHITGLTTVQQDSLMNNMQTAGIHWARVEFAWFTVEPSNGVFDFSAYDYIINGLQSRGIQIIGLCSQYWVPDWYRGANPNNQPPAPADYATWVGHVVAHYSGKIAIYEMGNEPNLDGFWYPAANAVAYTALMIAGTNAVRSNDPTAKVMSAGLSAGGIFPGTFLTTMYANGASAYMDYVGYHVYCYPDSPDVITAFATIHAPEFNWVAGIQGVMAANGEGNKPIILSEIGWPTSTPASGGVTQAVQAADIQRAFDKIMYEQYQNVLIACIYSLYDGGTDTTQPSQNFGIKLNDLSTPKIADATTLPALASDYAAHFNPINVGQSSYPGNVLTLRGTNIPSSTIATASRMVLDIPIDPGPSYITEVNTTTITTATSGQVYGEVLSQGGTSAGVTTLPTPTGKGWVYTLVAGTFAAGNWSASLALSLATVFTAGSTFIVRFYRLSGATYTSIGSITSPTITSGVYTVYSFAATSMGTITFSNGDRLYVDLWINDPGNVNNDNPHVYQSSNDQLGRANDMQITTASFSTVSTPLVVYGVNTADVVLATANTMTSTSLGTDHAITTTTNGTAGQVYGEIQSQGGTITGVTALPTPTGNGWFYQPGQGSFVAGPWSANATLSLNAWGGGGGNDQFIMRFYKYSSGVYTAIGSISVPPTATAKATYTFTATAMSSVTFAAADQLYIDLWKYDNNTSVLHDNPTVYLSPSVGWGVVGDMEVITAPFSIGQSGTPRDTATRLLLGLNALTVVISGVSVPILDKTLKISDKLDQRSTCQFTLVDAPGTGNYTKGMPVLVTDPNLGLLFSGYLNKATAVNLYPQTMRYWACDCVDQNWLADKRSSNTIYNNQYAGVIVADQVTSILSQEGVSGQYAVDFNHKQGDWAAGGATMTNVIATTNAGGGNAGDGDLELALAGSQAVTQFSDASPVNTTAIRLTGTLSQGYSQASLRVEIWTGSYTIATNDDLEYSMFIDGSSPEIKAGVGFVCSDGTTFGVNFAAIDNFHFISNDPTTDLTSIADNQWGGFHYNIGYGAFVGKVIKSINVAIYGTRNGTYTAYWNIINIFNSATLKQAIFNGVQTTLPVIARVLTAPGYSNISTTVVTAYQSSGFSGSYTTSPVTIAQSSQIRWDSVDVVGNPITSSATGTYNVYSSIDNGATVQLATNGGSIPNLLPGMSVGGDIFQIVASYTIGTDAGLAARLSGPITIINPSYNTTKSDVVKSFKVLSDFTTGTTLTNTKALTSPIDLLSGSTGAVMLNGYAIPFYTQGASYTVFSAGSPGTNQYIHTFQMTVNAVNDVKARLDTVGSWQNFTAEVSAQCVDSSQTGYSSSTGFVYRTTNWGTANNTFAYAVEMFENAIQLGKGTNSTGSGSYTLISSASVALTTNSWHTLGVIVNSTSHQVLLDGVVVISATDSTYTAAGGIGLRFFNANVSPAPTTYSTYFQNFGVAATTSGTWISPSISIAGASSYGNSVISWNQGMINWIANPAIEFLNPVDTAANVLIESSTNGGSTWQTVTNGGPIPSLTSGQSLSGVNLLLRATLSTGSVAFIPAIYGLTAWVVGNYSATGTWTSPALPLSSVGQVGNTMVNWNTAAPVVGTSVAISTSVDNQSTYQAVAAPGSAISNLITTAASPTEDTFSTNTSSSYTSTFGSGGAVATWTWDTANSRLVAVGGTRAVLTLSTLTGLGGVYNNGIYGSDVYAGSPSAVVGDVNLFCDMSQSQNGGLVWHWASASAYYELVVRDSAASGSPNTFTLLRSNVSVATGAITFITNSQHRIMVTMLGAVITAYFDGTKILTYTDGSPLAAGLCGLRNDTGTTRFYTFYMQAQGQNTTALSVYTKAVLSTTTPLATPQLLDISTLVAGATFGKGALIPNVAYQNTFVSQNIADLSKQSNYLWYINPSKKMVFQDRISTPAPWVLSDANASVTLAGQKIGDILLANMQVEYSGDLYRNRETLLNVNAAQAFTQTFIGDASSRTWTLSHPVAKGTIPTITVNGLVQTVGIKGLDTGKAYYYQATTPSIDQDTGQNVLGLGDTLVVAYSGAYLTTVVVDNTGAFAGTVSQAQYSAIDSTSGIIEDILDLSQEDFTANMDVATATQYGTQLLQRYGVVGRTFTFDTYRPGLSKGQQLVLFIPEHQAVDAQALVTQVDTNVQIGPSGLPLARYSVTATEGPNLGDWVRLFSNVFK